ncbi:DUF6671 family protein [Paucibacter sp. KCTC 42545]|uniref:DUF6671 family protein n=1 Tax=Paucibacter sp. KCTC 42545 TaxID=1768242 RepID=UPI000733BCB3|nr:DUF6671 family protein [Paucibacter sp. KCTC 42545]ALT78468.1 hypothetical protein AT984_15995 [Paucibacter sp. KCTC 42545]
MAAQSRYASRQVALLTQHGKQEVIAPVLEPALGCRIEWVSGFDTDQLGSFTRETPRPGSQLEAARRKARKGMELAGLSLGLASEGSFGPDPFTGMFPWNVELLVWIDDELGIEIVGMAQAAAPSGHLQSGDWQAIEAFALSEGFPQQQLVLRPNGPDDPNIHKGIQDPAQLRQCFDACLAQSSHRQVFAELDLRAHANPRRMKLIEQAAADLLQRIQSLCPACDAPGFWISERIAGLPCADCGLPTSSYRSERWSCPRCQHQELKPRTDRLLADSKHCFTCNP